LRIAIREAECIMNIPVFARPTAREDQSQSVGPLLRELRRQMQMKVLLQIKCNSASNFGNFVDINK